MTRSPIQARAGDRARAREYNGRVIARHGKTNLRYMSVCYHACMGMIKRFITKNVMRWLQVLLRIITDDGDKSLFYIGV